MSNLTETDIEKTVAVGETVEPKIVETASPEANDVSKDTSASSKPKVIKAPAKTFLVRIPLGIFTDHLDSLPESVQKKAKKMGLEKTSGNRVWGPTVEVSEREMNAMFETAETLYNTAKDKSVKTAGYAFRETLGEKLGRTINKRVYRPKKPEPVQVGGSMLEDRLAASHPPVPNVEKANAILNMAVTIATENDQLGIGQLIRLAQAEMQPEPA